MKVFNSSVEKRVEKNALKMKSPLLRVPSAHCTILVQCFRKNGMIWLVVLRGWKSFFASKGISIPVRQAFQLDFNRVLILADVVPFAVGMQPLADNLDQNFSYRNIRNFY
jgi:hypothetical protein